MTPSPSDSAALHTFRSSRPPPRADSSSPSLVWLTGAKLAPTRLPLACALTLRRRVMAAKARESFVKRIQVFGVCSEGCPCHAPNISNNYCYGNATYSYFCWRASGASLCQRLPVFLMRYKFGRSCREGWYISFNFVIVTYEKEVEVCEFHYHCNLQ